jgi:SAM-dependent methyltransferase
LFIRQFFQYLFLSFVDIVESILNRRDPLTPPRTKIFVGGGDFKETGIAFRELFKELGNLKPYHRVLDIGCGIGRMAAPLTEYLNKDGSYEGFDIVQDGIDWCQHNITPRFPNFRFALADIHNDHYHPAGKQKASAYHFPYESNSFDFVFLTSVFTHMPKPEVDHYVSEIGRVLKPGGRALVTFFLLNDDSRKLMVTSKSAHNIQHSIEGRYIAYPDDPEVCVGYDESYIKELFLLNSMNVTFYPGQWCGRDAFTSFQDIVIAQKP